MSWRLPAASRYSPELISVHGRPDEHPQAVEIVAQDRILDPQQLEAGLVDRVSSTNASLAPQASLASIMTSARLPTVLTEQLKAVQVTLEIRMADLDLERFIADRRGMAEKLGELAVAEMEIESRSIGPHTFALAAEQSM